jgi:flavin reductase (DIM6/NTAB) family NADH-FMN oxidoreductase RutF
MQFELARLSPRDRYKLLAGFIVPRPIALVSTRSTDGVDNLAPFSSFNYLGEDPPVIVLGLQVKRDGSIKDTTRNIRDTGEFVVNLVEEAIVEHQNICAVDFPPEVDEAEVTGLTLEPSIAVKPKRVKESPAAMECRRLAAIEFGPERVVCIGEVLWIHVREGLVDPETLYVDEEVYRPVGRIYGSL